MQRFSPLAILAILLALVSAPVYGATLQDTFKAAKQFQQEKKYDQAIVEYKKVVKLLVKAGNKPVAQQIQMNIGVLNFIQGRYERSVEAYQTALKLHSNPKPGFRLKLERNLASAHYKAGNFAIAAALRESIIADKALDPKLKSVLWAELAAAYRAGEMYSQAVGSYQKALQFQGKAENDQTRVLLLTSLGLSQAKLGRFEEATENLKQANDLAKKINKPQTVAESHSNLGVIYWDMGHYSAALKQLDLALEIEKSANLTENIGADLNNRGLVLKSAGKLSDSLNAIEEAARIAEKLKLPKDEAIALSNRALLLRIMGRNREAETGYQAALGLYEKVSFEEGRASCYLGLGKLSEVVDNNYQKAHDYYQKAIEIYKRLEILGYQAEGLNQLGRVLKKGIDKARTTRALMFEDEGPVFIDLPPDEAAKLSVQAFSEALKLGRITGRQEVIWSALQGLGFALKEQGHLKKALSRYQEAVSTVVNIRFGGADSELLADYLKDKEDLFTEAMEVCALLYAKTKDESYLKFQMEFQEIYKNEVMKGATAASGPSFEDGDKADLFNKLTGNGAKKKKLEQTQGRINGALEKEKAAKEGGKEAEQRRAKLEKESAQVKIESKKLDQTLKSLLAQWKKKYPADSGLFDSAAKVDLDKIRTGLAVDEALIQYFPLSDALSIICVTKEEISVATVPIPYPDLAELIRDKFSHRQIEVYGHADGTSPAQERQAYKECLQVMGDLHKVLIKPVAKPIAEKKRLIIVTSKYLSYVPFAALVQSIDAQGEPRFLVQDKAIAYLRLSFFDNYLKARGSGPVLDKAKMLVVGNPNHYQLRSGLKPLETAEKEARLVSRLATEAGLPKPTLLTTTEATEDTWRKLSLEDNFSVFYFATHGVPYAEILSDQRKMEARLIKWKEKEKEYSAQNNEEEATKKANLIAKYQPFVDFCKSTFTTKSPLNGFLYMSYSGREKHDGVLTLKEIMEMPDSVFSKARLAVLSACNTAVTYSPKIGKKLRTELESDQVSAELVKSGWTPGVDQISLTDTFMKRNFTSVLGTLWFADDKAAGYISSKFFEGLAKDNPSESLRQAQLSYLGNNPLPKDYTAVYKHPYYWAVAAVFGE